MAAGDWFDGRAGLRSLSWDPKLTESAMPPTFTLRFARLRVASLKRAEDFYCGVLGLTSDSGDPGERRLSADADGPPILVLRELPGAPPAPEDAAGLFHLAFLVPDRAALARVLLRIAARRWPLQGMSDHGVSEALYLADADGNGLEIYADRPRDQWPRRNGALEMYTRPLDVAALLENAPDRRGAGLPPGTRLGHVHLRVQDLSAAEPFYTRDLPLEVTARGYSGALFFAADGYHHNIAANTWGVRNAQPSTPHAGLDAVAASVRGLSSARVVTDPDGNRFELQPA